jgi:hypothetical protein
VACAEGALHRFDQRQPEAALMRCGTRTATEAVNMGACPMVAFNGLRLLQGRSFAVLCCAAQGC